MKSFFTAFVNSLYNFRWLFEQRLNTGKAFGYFFLFLLIIPIIFGASVGRVIPQFVSQARQFVDTELPEFRATISNSKLVIEDLPQPYVKEVTEDDDPFTLVIDTVSTTTIEAATEAQKKKSDQNFMLILADGFVMYDAESLKTETQQWGDFPEFSVTKSEITGWVNKLSVPFMIFVVTILLLLLYAVFAVGKLIQLLIISLIVLLIAKIVSREITFGQVYTIGLYAITLPTLVVQILRLLGVSTPFIYTLILGILMIGTVLQKPSQPAVMPPATPTV